MEREVVYTGEKVSQEETQTQTQEQREILREILKEILNKKTLVININDIENPLELSNDDYFVTENLITLPCIKKLLLDQSEINFIRFIDEKIFKISAEKIVTKYILYKTTSCTKQNEIFSLLLQKAYELLTVKKNEHFNQIYEGKVIFEIYDGDKKLATIVKKIFYCNHCLDDREVNIGIQKCVKFYIK